MSESQALKGCGFAVAFLVAACAAIALPYRPAQASQPVVCGGAAMQGGAQLLCSHTDPDKPAQFCTFTWDLMRMDMSAQVVQGSFLLPPGAANVQEYQGNGFASQITTPIVICRGKKSNPEPND